MGEAGVLTEDDRVELLDGEIVRMSPIGIRHSSTVDRLNGFFSRRLGREAVIRVQGPIVLDPDFEAVAGLAGHRRKPERAWREFASRPSAEMPEPLVRVAERAISLARAR